MKKNEAVEYLLTFTQFLESLKENEERKQADREVTRFQELAGLVESDLTSETYAIRVTLQKPSNVNLLLEHESYKKFQKTNNRYSFHSENPNIPVKGHYHIYPSNSKKELYAVNIDGSAHHKRNRGYTVPSREADELRKLGVKIPSNNIVESKEFVFTESEDDKYFFAYVVIDK